MKTGLDTTQYDYDTWQSDVIPKECLKFRLDKKQGSVAINGVETIHSPDAQEIIDCSGSKCKSKVFPNRQEALKSLRSEDGK